MAIRFETQDGQQGTFDVVEYLQADGGGEVIGVKDGLVQTKKPDGGTTAFSLANWAETHQVNIVFMEGFNAPDTALEVPPNGMNYFDQAVFFHDGMDMNALQGMFPQATKNTNGAIVVLDSDGLWKTMWSPYVQAPEAPLTHDQEVRSGIVNDPKLVMRTAGVLFLMGLAGVDGTESEDPRGGVRIEELIQTLEIISRNAPHENKFQIAKFVEQTTGLAQFKFTNALLAPNDIAHWLNSALQLTTFDFRMLQMKTVQKVVDGLRSIAQKDFEEQMHPLLKLDETKTLLINLKQIFSEFIQFLVGLDLLRDISRSTGLNEWIAMNEDSALDPSKLPAMPEFVERFVGLLRWAMPIVEDGPLAFARGKNGFKSIMALMTMIDDCIYSLAGVPDSSSKYKMFMALKKLQSQIESKLSFTYHPDPMKNKNGLRENPFMQAKKIYSEKREQIYKLCQTPKEAWNNTMLETIKTQPNIEQFYDSLPPQISKAFKSFVAMDAAYDMQPWIDVDHAKRTNDPFSTFDESFGLPPPEAGYLAKNSPRAINEIAETLIESSAYLVDLDAEDTKGILRNPFMMSNLLKTVMTASVNRELGTVEMLERFGMTSIDNYASPDPSRIWEDPEMVDKDNKRQIEELMGSLAMEAAMTQQSQQDSMVQQQGQQESMRDEGNVEKAGAGPSGPPTRAMPMAG